MPGGSSVAKVIMESDQSEPISGDLDPGQGAIYFHEEPSGDVRIKVAVKKTDGTFNLRYLR
jgi:hypothetical protein